jgi:hypothetical protein
MLIARSVAGVPVRLTQERWEHIRRRHPELSTQRGRVADTISKPHEVFAGDYGEKLAVRFYRRTPLTSKWLVAAYRELGHDDGFVITAYLAPKAPRWRKRLWRQ